MQLIFSNALFRPNIGQSIFIKTGRLMDTFTMEKIADPLVENGPDHVQIIEGRKAWIRRALETAGRGEQPLRVLIATTGLGPGGAEQQVLRVMPYLIQLGVQAEHLYFDRSSALLPRFEAAGLATHFIDLQAVGAVGFIRKAVQFIRARHYDVVMGFIGMTNVYVRLAAILSGVPVVIACSRSRVLYKEGSKRFLLSVLNPFTDAWIVNAATNIESLQQLWLMRNRSIYLVPNALDFRGGDYSAPKPLDPDLRAWVGDRMVVGTCGWISEPKNFDMFFDLAKKINVQRKDTCFMLIGGPRPAQDSRRMADRLQQRIIDENLSGFIKMLGPREDAQDIMPNFTLLAYTSIWEGCPNAVIEAMRASLPVVMTRACDTGLLIEEGKNGYVVEKNDVAAMAEKVDALLNDPGMRAAFGKRSRELAELHFSGENSTWKFVLVFLKHLLAKKRT